MVMGMAAGLILPAVTSSDKGAEAAQSWEEVAKVLAGLIAGPVYLFGILKTTKGLGYQGGTRIGAFLLLTIFGPLSFLGYLVFVSPKITQLLRQAGYEVGFIGAKAKKG
jgi:hypothetical protein